MAEVQKMGTLFEPELVADLFNKARGKSVLAKLSPQAPISFTGNDIFTFDMPGDVAIVAEGAAKPHGGIEVKPVKVAPIKIVYQARVTDEFMIASAERRLEILEAFMDGFAAKAAAGLDKIFIHGVNPATGTTSDLVKSYFDKDVTNTAAYTVAAGGDAAIESAVAMLGDFDVNGLALSKAFAAAMALEVDGNKAKKFPELAWGGNPEALRGIKTAISGTVASDLGIVGDFNMFRWGYAKAVTFETIQYGDPDQSGVDLKANNQVMLRAEAYIGGAVVVPEAFARITGTIGA